MRPTIVLVHGAFADASSWDPVVDRLLDTGHPVLAVANPLRGVAADAAGVSDHIRSIDGPVLLAGHSYGGAGMSAQNCSWNRSWTIVRSVVPSLREIGCSASPRVLPGKTAESSKQLSPGSGAKAAT